MGKGTDRKGDRWDRNEDRKTERVNDGNEKKKKKNAFMVVYVKLKVKLFLSEGDEKRISYKRERERDKVN